MMRRFHVACLERGVYLHYVSPHHGYSSAHTMADVEETLGVMEEAVKVLS
jgi:glutamate-1-semialdehyde aminotransferase